MQLKTDIVVIGAGPAGSISAGILHKNGLNVRVIEKEVFPRFVIGESLLPRCMMHLEEAGLLEDVKAFGFQQKAGAKFIRDEAICDFNFSDQFTKGWTWTWQVPRADFDNVLIQSLIKKGVSVNFGTSVEHIDFSADRQVVHVRNPDGSSEKIECRFVIDGSGYGRVIPRMLGLDKPSDFPPRRAVFSHFKDPNRKTDAESNRISVVLLNEHLWAWMIPFSNGNTSLGFVGEIDAFQRHEDRDQELKALMDSNAYITNRLGFEDRIFPARELTGYSISVSRFYGEGFVLTGNSTEFLDPIFSSGVTFAMESGATAARLVIRHLNGEQVDWETDFVKHIQSGVDVFRDYVSGWYSGALPSIFFSERINTDFKNQICSVLAGYVWDKNNPFVSKSDSLINTLAEVVRIQKAI